MGIIKPAGFALIAIGTVGLLITEFIFDIGRTATITFAVLNAAGLLILGFTHWMLERD
ncbi:hypothetical protein ACFLTT_00950 [Chloroflexota bacterium]